MGLCSKIHANVISAAGKKPHYRSSLLWSMTDCIFHMIQGVYGKIQCGAKENGVT